MKWVFVDHHFDAEDDAAEDDAAGDDVDAGTHLPLLVIFIVTVGLTLFCNSQ